LFAGNLSLRMVLLVKGQERGSNLCYLFPQVLWRQDLHQRAKTQDVTPGDFLSLKGEGEPDPASSIGRRYLLNLLLDFFAIPERKTRNQGGSDTNEN
jgi:hypothetical protein